MDEQLKSIENRIVGLQKRADQVDKDLCTLSLYAYKDPLERLRKEVAGLHTSLRCIEAAEEARKQGLLGWFLRRIGYFQGAL